MTDYNVDEIKAQFERIIEYSQNIDYADVNELFQNWETNKQPFIEAFGGQLIYEFPLEVNFPLDEKFKDEKISEFLERVNCIYGYDDLYDFIEANRENFFDNLVLNEYRFKDHIIKPKTKIIKAFKYFVSNETALRDLQDDASRLIQENKITGKFCVSVHPLDFLTTSINTYNWRSCHSLDGEYRSGNLSYMADNSTIICYVKGQENVSLPLLPSDIKWNSKKWRMLLNLSPIDKHEKSIIAWAGRQYPFSSLKILDFIHSEVLPLFNSDFDWTFFNNITLDAITADDFNGGRNYSLHRRYFAYKQELYPLSNKIIDKSELHFNDLLNSHCYRPYCSIGFKSPYFLTNLILDGPSYENLPKIEVGHNVKCPCCGTFNIDDSEFMMCNNCYDGYNDDYRYCDCCGTAYPEEEMMYTADDECICQRCFSNYFGVCEECESTYRMEDFRYDDEEEKYLCPDCYKALLKRREKENKLGQN